PDAVGLPDLLWHLRAVRRVFPAISALLADDLDVGNARSVAGCARTRGGPLMPDIALQGLMAEFATPDEILAAARRARQQGYRKVEAYAPYSVEGLGEELGMDRSAVPFVVLVAGLVGAGAGFFMQYWSIGVNYPLDVGGRPLNSWPVYIPITFEV